MRTPTGIEQRLLQAQQEILQNCPEFAVVRSITGDLGEFFSEAPALFSYLPDWQGVQLSTQLCVGSPRISEIANCWNREPSDTAEIGGEFRVTDLSLRCSSTSRPGLVRFHGRRARVLHTVACHRRHPTLAAMGQLAAIRIQPEVDPLEIWYYDMELTSIESWTRQYVRLDLTYTEYMEQLAITKGTFGWQYLFAEEVMLPRPSRL